MDSRGSRIDNRERSGPQGSAGAAFWRLKEWITCRPCIGRSATLEKPLIPIGWFPRRNVSVKDAWNFVKCAGYSYLYLHVPDLHCSCRQYATGINLRFHLNDAM